MYTVKKWDYSIIGTEILISEHIMVGMWEQLKTYNYKENYNIKDFTLETLSNAMNKYMGRPRKGHSPNHLKTNKIRNK